MIDRLKFLWLGIRATWSLSVLRPWPDRILACVIGPFILTIHFAFNTFLFRSCYRMYLLETNRPEKL